MLNTKNRFWASKVGLSYTFLCKLLVLLICWSQKSIFRIQHESDIQTLLGAKQPYQVASFHLSLSGSKADWFWKNRFFPLFFDFKGCSKGPKMGDPPQTILLRMAKKLRKRGSITSKLSDLVEEVLSYLRIYFGGLGDVWNFWNWIFSKKNSKKWRTQKYPPPV